MHGVLQHARLTEKIDERLRSVLTREGPEPRAAAPREDHPIEFPFVSLSLPLRAHRVPSDTCINVQRYVFVMPTSLYAKDERQTRPDGRLTRRTARVCIAIRNLAAGKCVI